MENDKNTSRSEAHKLGIISDFIQTPPRFGSRIADLRSGCLMLICASVFATSVEAVIQDRREEAAASRINLPGGRPPPKHYWNPPATHPLLKSSAPVPGGTGF